VDVAIATCVAQPHIDKDDRLLVNALRSLGVRAVAAAWNDPWMDWSRPSLCVIRSTWDYADRRMSFIDWARQMDARGRLWNSGSIVEWNTHKSYLRDLAASGIAVVPTRWFQRGAAVQLGNVLAEEGWERAVYKPAISLAAQNTALVAGSMAPAQHARFDQLLASRDMMVQPFVESVVEHGELLVVFIDGEYSHAVLRRPPMGSFITHEWYGGTVEAVEPTQSQREAAEAVIARLSKPTLYARVDLVDHDDHPLLQELELVEPRLYLGFSASAPERLARAVLRRLDAVARVDASPRGTASTVTSAGSRQLMAPL
jgi:glutathione synthase/RimK-type ligase-like ATP-grasp enzyme